MILVIPDLVRRFMPDLLRGGPVSVACVRTTRPKFLVFGADADRRQAIDVEGDQSGNVSVRINRSQRRISDRTGERQRLQSSGRDAPRLVVVLSAACPCCRARYPAPPVAGTAVTRVRGNRCGDAGENAG